MDWRDEIKKFVIERAGDIPQGEPRRYVDVKGMISQPDLLYGVIKEIGDLILKKYPEIKAIGSHGVGGTFLVGPTMLYVYNHWFNICGFFVRLDERENGVHRPIEGCLDSGWRVVIVDTMIKTGQSSLKAHEILKARGCRVDGMIVVADLSGGDNACTRAGLKVESLVRV